MLHLEETLLGTLPPLVSRKVASEALGGLISPKTLCHRDAAGSGPKERIKLGRKVAYPREAFVEWVMTNISMLSVSES